MICSAKPVLTEELCVVQTEEFSITCYMCDTYTWQRPGIFIRGKPIFWSERLLQKAYDRKRSVDIISLIEGLKWPEAKMN
jgi:hypothetical protein